MADPGVAAPPMAECRVTLPSRAPAGSEKGSCSAAAVKVTLTVTWKDVSPTAAVLGAV